MSTALQLFCISQGSSAKSHAALMSVSPLVVGGCDWGFGVCVCVCMGGGGGVFGKCVLLSKRRAVGGSVVVVCGGVVGGVWGGGGVVIGNMCQLLNERTGGGTVGTEVLSLTPALCY